MAEFASAEQLIKAARVVRGAGFRQIDAYSPFPIEELPEALGLPASRIPWVMFGGGIFGAALGWGMQYYATVISYPMNIGGHSLPAWPALIPVTFELTIFCAVMGGVLAFLYLTRLPEVYHPVFSHPDFRRASQDSFFLCIEAKDAKFDPRRTTEFLNMLEPISVLEVEE